MGFGVEGDAVAIRVGSDVPGRGGVDSSRPHSARMYDCYLGGKDNYESDRDAVAAVERAFPTVRSSARANRGFMHRATRYLAAEAGVRQFLDIGIGMPTPLNLHQVAQEVAPAARVVYVDHDPLVLCHARALMVGTVQGRIAYVHADVTAPETILAAPEIANVFDMARPIALSLIALMHFVGDGQRDPYQIVDSLIGALAPGSYLVMTHLTHDDNPAEVMNAVEAYREHGLFLQARSHDEFARFFTGLELVEPGIVGPHRWKAGIQPARSMDARVSLHAAVARTR